MDKQATILKGEQDFARQVALAIVMATPASAWRALIPFMFMFDALIRGRTIRNYTAFHLFPKRLALQAAVGGAEAPGERQADMDRELKSWLERLGLYDPTTLEAEMGLVELLADHYRKLLAALGRSHEEMIANAYGTRLAYAGLLEEIARQEQEVARRMVALAGQDEALREKFEIERRQLQRLREKQVDRVFADPNREQA